MLVNLAALDDDLVDLAVTADRTLRARLVSRTRHADGSESWAGQIEGEPFSAATFVRAGNILQGSVRTLEAAYSIEPLSADGFHVVREIDVQATGAELPARIPDALPMLADTPPTSSDDGSLFDVLVVYTAAARSAAGGEARDCWRASISASPKPIPPTRTAGSFPGCGWWLRRRSPTRRAAISKRI